jgi:hypothetical protein
VRREDDVAAAAGHAGRAMAVYDALGSLGEVAEARLLIGD